MSAPLSQSQKAGDPSPYASLRPSVVADAQDTQPSPQPPPPVSPSPGFAAELAKLQELRAALWEAFKAGPDAGLPTILIELTNSYTNSLRLQLNMKALDARKLTPSPPTNQPGAGVKK